MRWPLDAEKWLGETQNQLWEAVSACVPNTCNASDKFGICFRELLLGRTLKHVPFRYGRRSNIAQTVAIHSRCVLSYSPSLLVRQLHHHPIGFAFLSDRSCASTHQTWTCKYQCHYSFVIPRTATSTVAWKLAFAESSSSHRGISCFKRGYTAASFLAFRFTGTRFLHKSKQKVQRRYISSGNISVWKHSVQRFVFSWHSSCPSPLQIASSKRRGRNSSFSPQKKKYFSMFRVDTAPRKCVKSCSWSLFPAV